MGIRTIETSVTVHDSYLDGKGRERCLNFDLDYTICE